LLTLDGVHVDRMGEDRWLKIAWNFKHPGHRVRGRQKIYL